MLDKHLEQMITDINTGKVRFTKSYIRKWSRRYAQQGFDIRQSFNDRQVARQALAKVIVSRLTDQDCDALIKLLHISGIWKES